MDSLVDQDDFKIKCSFCTRKYDQVIKLIIECGNSVCGKCYENITMAKQYKCFVCQEEHYVPEGGLPNNKQLMETVNAFRTTLKKPLPEKAKKLKTQIREIEAQLETLELFDCADFICDYCLQLEHRVDETIKSAIVFLNEKQENWLKKINAYRDECLKKISDKPSRHTKAEFFATKDHFNEFNTRCSILTQKESTSETDSDVEAAFAQLDQFASKLKSVKKMMENDVLGEKMLVFRINQHFGNDFGGIEEIYDREELEEATKPNTEAIVSNKPPGEKRLKIRMKSTLISSDTCEVGQVVFLPNGRLVNGGEYAIAIWDIGSQKELFQLQVYSGDNNALRKMDILANGRLVSCSRAGYSISIWDLDRRVENRIIDSSYQIKSLCALKNGYLAWFDENRSICIWNSNSENNKPDLIIQAFTKSEESARLGALSNEHLVTCTRDLGENYLLRVWNPNNGMRVKTIDTCLNETVKSLLVLLDDQVAIGTDEGTIKIINMNDKNLSKTKREAHERSVSSLAQFSNGNLLSAGNVNKKHNIRVWDLTGFILLQDITTPHLESISSLIISPDEKFLVSGSLKEAVILWSIVNESRNLNLLKSRVTNLLNFS